MGHDRKNEAAIRAALADAGPFDQAEDGCWVLCGEDDPDEPDDVGLLCDGCDCAYHIDWLQQDGYEVDAERSHNDEDWFCPNCEVDADDNADLTFR